MKRNEGKYDVVNKLPKGAMLVKDYADSVGIKENTVYSQIARKTAKFKIVIYYERNFVIPE